jgi:hypothetical protein
MMDMTVRTIERTTSPSGEATVDAHGKQSHPTGLWSETCYRYLASRALLEKACALEVRVGKVGKPCGGSTAHDLARLDVDRVNHATGNAARGSSVVPVATNAPRSHAAE